MSIKKQPLNVRLFIAIGLLMVTLPALLRQLITLPDFVHGLLMGAGLGLEIIGLIKLRRNQERDAAC